ncbi:orph-Q6 [Microplitis demolitor]|uniref:hypothetical protein n=1 Tax=Microplitis demolitor TaxID=69319 RepID=UPI0004400407|nr:hypothetical protein [Microplitis demolitor]KAG6558492.1 orph-Q6 [Microplitis demolitor]
MSKKFTVVKFSDISTYGRNPYKCVPSWWIVKRHINYVTVPYPPRTEIVLAFKNIINCEPPLHGWNEYCGTVEYVTDSYAEGLMFIKDQDPHCIPEELIFVSQLTGNILSPTKKSNALITFLSKIWLRFYRTFKK